MRKLAETVMRGRLQAAAFALLLAAMPMMFWLSAAIVTLVTLRRGIADGLAVAPWAILPLLGWAWAGQPLGLFCMLLTLAMAVCLRQTMSWTLALMVMVPAGLLVAWGIGEFYSPIMSQIVSAFHQLYGPKLNTLFAQGAEISELELKVLIETSFVKSISLIICISSVLALLMGRWWQALLYNPGGLREELYQLRFSPKVAVMLIAALVLVSFNHGLVAAALQPILIMPLLVAGSVLVHSLIWKRKMGRGWLVLYYMLLLAAYPMVVMLACLDSFVHFRARLEHRLSD